MKNVGIVYDPIYLKHNTGSHPERAARLERTVEKLQENAMWGDDRKENFIPIPVHKAEYEQIEWVHTKSLIKQVMEKVKSIEGSGMLTQMDADTIVSENTLEAALAAVGGNFAAIDAIMDGKIERGFVLCRPPGHHSNRRRSRGFCIFNNIALDVEYIHRKKGLKKVAIVDFDVHAGNGTEEIFERGPLNDEGELLMFSIHQHPYTLYPGTCFMEDIGSGKQKGRICNVTLYPGAGENSVKKSFKEIILPMLNEFKPEFILVSAGYDAHYADPLAGLKYNTQLYSWMIDRLKEISEKYAQNRILCTLEGGYDLDALSSSIVNTISSLAEGSVIYEDDNYENENAIKNTEEKVIPTLRKIFSEFWNNIKE